MQQARPLSVFRKRVLFFNPLLSPTTPTPADKRCKIRFGLPIPDFAAQRRLKTILRIYQASYYRTPANLSGVIPQPTVLTEYSNSLFTPANRGKSSSISNLRATRTMEMDRVTAYRHEEKEKWHKIVIKVSPFRLFENKKKRRVFLFSRVRDGSSLPNW